MTREQALAFIRLEIDHDLVSRGYVSPAAANSAAEALTIVLEKEYVAFSKGYKHSVMPATGELQLIQRIK